MKITTNIGDVNQPKTPFKKIALAGAAIVLMAGCSQAENVAHSVADQVHDTATATGEAAQKAAATAKDKASEMTSEIASKMTKPAADLSALPSGTYKSDQGHAYVTFTYWHQGYSKPVLRWGETNATIVFDNETPENSTLSVNIPVASIDSGVDAFDDHLKSADFFEVDTYPEITFESTKVDQDFMGAGSVMGDMTIKGVTKPVKFTGRINKVGKDSKTQNDIFGVSATASLKRSDFNVGKYVPHVGDDVEIKVEIEFRKSE